MMLNEKKQMDCIYGRIPLLKNIQKTEMHKHVCGKNINILTVTISGA